jgi:hypothetical protein
VFFVYGIPNTESQWQAKKTEEEFKNIIFAYTYVTVFVIIFSLEIDIDKTFAEFRETVRNSLLFPRNFRYFRTAYGIYGSDQNLRNSMPTEFRKHSTSDIFFETYQPPTAQPVCGHLNHEIKKKIGMLITLNSIEFTRIKIYDFQSGFDSYL